MTTMQINGSESGTVRLFHLDLPAEAIERFTTQAGTGEWPLQYALGAHRLRPAFIDVVSIRDLDSMSLSAYLAEAHQVKGSEFRGMRGQIDALRGHVVILPSQAFDHTSQTLTISQPLRWIGSFEEETARPRDASLSSRSAQGTATGQGGGGLGATRSPVLKLVLIGAAILILLVIALALRQGG
ncbi:aspartate carbamoyltransferase catalytic subunit [Salipiger sp.]|uniref:aspartate carbamoyltransferase catalytic subunit n=1 Tax=Salipiger sp. TaxID=2078585 RepID=UPI003A96C958